MLSSGTQTKTGLADLSLDVISQITTFLSLKSFYNFKSTCKAFQSLAYNGRNYPSYNQFFFLFRLAAKTESERKVSKETLDALMAGMVRKRHFSHKQITTAILTECVYLQLMELFKAIIDSGMDSVKMQFLLCEVVTQSQLEMVKLLVVKNVDMEVRDQLALPGNKHDTPVITALTKGGYEILDLLLKSGANGELLDTNLDKTPLMRAARRSEACCEIFINNGVNIDAANQAGCSALFFCKNAAVFRHLIEKGAAIDLKDNTGSTILHHAVEMKKLIMYREMLKSGIDSSIRNMKGYTALDLLKISYKGVKGLKEILKSTEKEVVDWLIKKKF